MILPICPQRYCDPASLVTVLRASKRVITRYCQWVGRSKSIGHDVRPLKLVVWSVDHANV